MKNSWFWNQIYPQKIKRKKCWKKCQSIISIKQCIPAPIWSQFQSFWRKPDFRTKFSQKKIEWKRKWKNKCQNCDQHIKMYPCNIFSSFGELWNQMCPKQMKGNILEKRNFTMYTTTELRFTQFKEHSILWLNFPDKKIRWERSDKRNKRIQ